MYATVQSADARTFDKKAVIDVICIGGGAAGLSAAVCARAFGLNVLLLEKDDQVGGATAFSGGAVWIPDNASMPDGDDLESARTYLRGVLGNDYDATKIDAYLSQATEMLAFLEQVSEVRFGGLQSPDYYPNLPGASRGRTIMAMSFDAHRLGRRLAMMRLPLAPLTLNGMQFEMQDLATLQNALKSPTGLVRSSILLARYLLGRLRYGRDPRLVRGNALVGRLLISALDSGVSVWTKAEIRSVSRKGASAPFRVEVAVADRREVLLARNLVLATGGFGASPDLVSQYMPQDAGRRTLQPPANTGDGIAIGSRLGGGMETENAAPAIWSPVSEAVVRGRKVRFPHLMMDRLKPGSLMVTGTGRRFTNEGGSYQDVVEAMHHQKIDVAYLVADRDFVRRYGLGLVRPAPFSFSWALRSGYLVRRSTLEELGQALGLPAGGLVDTVERFNGFARSGVDDDFQRGDDAYSRHHGEPGHAPNPGLGEIRRPPFFAIRLYPGNLGTVQGLRTDAHARVLDAASHPIPGLYACGADMNSIMRGHYPGGGASIGAAMTFAYIAAKDMARNADA